MKEEQGDVRVMIAIRDSRVSVMWEIARAFVTIVGGFIAMVAYGVLSSAHPWFAPVFWAVLVGSILCSVWWRCSRPYQTLRTASEFPGHGPDGEGGEDGLGCPVPVFPISPLESAGAKEFPGRSRSD